MIRAGTTIAALAISCAVGAGASAWAQSKDRTVLGEYDDWLAIEGSTSKGKICYVISPPKDSEPKNVRRDAVYFMIVHRPYDKVKNEVTTVIGYPFKKDEDAITEIGSTKFSMFTKGDSAWVDLPETEAKIVAAMKKGSKMVVHGTSWRGTKTTDQYSLKGVTAALDQIDKACQ
jgi:hypothetical protein